MTGRMILYAPNVHTGGGLVLLQALLRAYPAGRPLLGWFDRRAAGALPIDAGVQARWVVASAASRLGAELQLRAEAREGDLVLCFHGLPPLLPCRGRVEVFFQNRNYLGLNPLSDFAAKTAIRIAFERAISRSLRHRVTRYLVQTPTMARDLQRWLGEPHDSERVKILPFVDPLPAAADPRPAGRQWDFIYVADGVGHKNHLRLVQAWRLLSLQGLTPSLALTLGPRDSGLAGAIETEARAGGLRIHNLGMLPRETLASLYRQCGALIFPSTSESFGLPLIEARQAGLPILAPEADYVRDVCEPAQTFDPSSAVSIARAVQRFLGQPQPPLEPAGAEGFWSALCGEPAFA